MERIKDIISNYTIWGLFLGFITIAIKPFVSITSSMRDMLITFIMSMLSGLLIEYIDIPIPVKYGISGVCGLFALRLYMIIDNLLRSAQNDPLKFMQDIHKKK